MADHSDAAGAEDAGDAMARANAIANSSRRVEATGIEMAQAGIEEYSAEGARYTLERLVGRGAYGAVYIATDSADGSRVAIKHVVKAIKSDTDARRTYREMLVQSHFEHPNILALQHVLTPKHRGDFTSIYLVMEVMETDLHRVIHSRQDLTSDHISYFTYQLLCGLRHLHAAGVLHRDLKPSNLLVNSDCTLKLCDFGLARESDVSLSTALTEYVVTRWYRAPEVLLSGGRYSAAIDVWSVGCILAELLLRRPLFPGDNYLNQLQLIAERLGSPSEDDLHFVTNPNARAFMLRLPHSDGTPIAEIFPHVRGPCLDLLARMLVFDPASRISVEEALAHPFLSRVRAARSQVSEPPLPPRFRMHPRLKSLKASEIRRLFVERLCGSYTPDKVLPSGVLFPPPASAALQRRRAPPAPPSSHATGAPSSSSSSAPRPGDSGAAGPLSPPPQRAPPRMRDGMFVAEGAAPASGRAGRAGPSAAGARPRRDPYRPAAAAHKDDMDGFEDEDEDEDEDEEGFEDARGMGDEDLRGAGAGPAQEAAWLNDDGTSSAGPTTAGSGATHPAVAAEAFVNAGDDDDDDEDVDGDAVAAPRTAAVASSAGLGRGAGDGATAGPGT
ncbi:hypothetical protein FNF31_04592 [Cafeteria roenbergensis]|uniref:Protein kinase domain-containing protein n=1 Tax=Cafeteria roenbergensis TaxID=33653 RepID=A0A5A8D5Q2_CAFRO|nr:hypothetical protein FNF31_04592 [Cafeteria roenbergensis]